MKKKKFLWVLAILVFLFAVAVPAGFIMVDKKVPVVIPENLTDTMRELRESYDNFRGMSGLQLHIFHSKLFFYGRYRMDGRIKENEYDCAESETMFWRSMGANVEYETTEDKEGRMGKICKPHVSIQTVEIGDIIFFKRSEKYGHISIIEYIDKDKKIMRYMDMNVNENGPGYNTIRFDDQRIQAVYPMNFAYWCGNVLSRFDRKLNKEKIGK